MAEADKLNIDSIIQRLLEGKRLCLMHFNVIILLDFCCPRSASFSFNSIIDFIIIFDCFALS